MSSLFRTEVVTQQQQRLQGEVNLTQPVSFIGFTVLISALALCALLFLYFSEYQRKERVQGTIELASTAIYLHSAVAANLAETLVQVGEQVQQGQALVQLQQTPATAEPPFLLKAPFSGTIVDVLWPSGQEISPAQPLLSLLPQAETLLAVVYVRPEIIDLLSLGQVVQMRIEALPYQHFGVQAATVIELGNQLVSKNDSQLQPLSEPSYRVVLVLTKNSKRLPLKEGMKLEADISTAPRRLIHWLFAAEVYEKVEI